MNYAEPLSGMAASTPSGAPTIKVLSGAQRKTLIQLVGEAHRTATDRELVIRALKASGIDPQYTRSPHAPDFPRGPVLASYRTEYLAVLALDAAKPMLAIRGDERPPGQLIGEMLAQREKEQGKQAATKMRQELAGKPPAYVRGRWESLAEIRAQDQNRERFSRPMRVDEAQLEREKRAKEWREQWKKPAPDHRRNKPAATKKAAMRGDTDEPKLSWRDQWKHPPTAHRPKQRGAK